VLVVGNVYCQVREISVMIEEQAEVSSGLPSSSRIKACDYLMVQVEKGPSRCYCWKTNSHDSTVITQMRAYDSG
jgi:hypothetical protein